MLKLRALKEAQKREEHAASGGGATASPAAGPLSPANGGVGATAPHSGGGGGGGGAGANGNSAAGSASTSSGGEAPFVLRKQPSKELVEIRKQKSKESIISLRKGGGGRGDKGKKGKPTAGELRAQKDIAELESAPGIRYEFPEENNIMHFLVFIRPGDGLYKGAEFRFAIAVPLNFPYEPPKVTCETLVYHPNIDFEGHVCLNILRQDWSPVLNLGSVMYGLMTLFLEPNPDDPLNKDAAKLMIEKLSEFQNNVRQSLRGGHVIGKQFPKLLS